MFFFLFVLYSLLPIHPSSCHGYHNLSMPHHLLQNKSNSKQSELQHDDEQSMVTAVASEFLNQQKVCVAVDIHVIL